MIRALESTYLLTLDGEIVERPQYAYMRIALAIHGVDIPRIMKTYDHLSRQLYVHEPSAIMFAGTRCANLCASYLSSVHDGRLESIYNTLIDTAKIGLVGGVVGLTVGSVPSSE